MRSRHNRLTQPATVLYAQPTAWICSRRPPATAGLEVNPSPSARRPDLCRRPGSRLRFLFCLLSFSALSATAQQLLSSSNAPSVQPPPTLDAAASQSDLLLTNWNIGFALGAGVGLSAFGSTEAHDLAIATLHVGKPLVSHDHTFGPFIRHLELAGEVWTGAQYHPNTAYLVGLTPFLRYCCSPDARWSPFLDAGAGVTATDIRHPDLSTIFEFNVQAGTGFHWKLSQNTAFTFQARYIHLSNARLDTPNLGVNSLVFSAGLTWFF